MKTLKRLSLWIIMATVVVSCDELDELTEVDINEDFNTTYMIDVAEDDPLTYFQTQTIDIASNPDIQNNLDRLEGVTLDRLTYEIDNYTGQAGILTNASFQLGETTISVSDIDLQQSDIDNEVYDIGDANELSVIANALRNDLVNNNMFTATVSGTVSDAPVTFTIKVALEVTFTVNGV